MKTPKQTKRKLPVTPKTSRKRRFITKTTGAIYRSVQPIVKQTLVRNLRYCDTISLNAGLAQAAHHVFRANDCYDPDQTGVGHQPRGYDQYVAMYARWFVRKSKITVHAGSSQYSVVGVSVTTLPNTSLSLLDQTEQAVVSYKMINVNSANDPITQTFDLQTWKRQVGDGMADNAIHGASGASPSEQFFFNVFTFDTNATIDPTAVVLFVTIDYEVVFFDPISPIVS